MDNNFIVYCHTLNSDGRKYIGITSRDAELRWANGKGYHHNMYFTNAINKYGWDSFSHEILYTHLSEKEAKAKEIELIAKFDTTNREKGFNNTSGGDGILKPNDEIRKKMSNHMKGNKNSLGKILSTRAKKQISKKLKGHIVTKETRDKLSNSHKGKVVSEETRKKLSNSHKGLNINEKLKKKIICIDTGIIYNGLRETERLTGIKRQSIIRSCRTNFKAGGYRWRYYKKGGD